MKSFLLFFLQRSFLRFQAMEHFSIRHRVFKVTVASSLCFQEIPQQMNGSDCGMFTCKYADYVTKDKPITFTQVTSTTSNTPHFVLLS